MKNMGKFRINWSVVFFSFYVYASDHSYERTIKTTNTTLLMETIFVLESVHTWRFWDVVF